MKTTVPISRRRMLGLLAATAATASGCSTLRLAGALVPGAQAKARLREVPVMHAFCRVVIPVSDTEAASVARVYEDPQFPLGSHLPLLIRDLEAHDLLEAGDAERAEIVRHGAESRGPVGRLYRGAILLTQAAYYGSIYDDALGCVAIDWPGAARLPLRADMTYPDPHAFLGRSTSADGNPS
jgi:hypothetical protein